MLLGLMVIGTFGILAMLSRFVYGENWPLSFKGRFSVSVALLFTTIVTILNIEPMTGMLPASWNNKEVILYSFAGLNVFFAIGILYPKIIKWKSILLMFYLASWIPFYVIGTNHGVEFARMQIGPVNLYCKIPVQIGMVIWVYYFGVKEIIVKPRKSKMAAKSGAAVRSKGKAVRSGTTSKSAGATGSKKKTSASAKKQPVKKGTATAAQRKTGKK